MLLANISQGMKYQKTLILAGGGDQHRMAKWKHRKGRLMYVFIMFVKH